MKMLLAGAMLVMSNVAIAQNLEGPIRVRERQVMPAIDTVRTVSAGEEFFKVLTVTPITVAMIDEPATDAKHKIVVPAKMPLYSVNTKSFLKVCLLGNSEAYFPLGTGTGGGCGLDDDGDGTIDRVASDWMGGAKPAVQKVKYTKSTILMHIPQSFEQRVLYQGATGDTLKLSYREFSGDIARQPFTEELSIPLGKTFPQLIAVKGERFRLIAIDGLGLQYERVTVE
jgi:hypothetical protein